MKISIVLAALTGSFETDMTRASKTAQKRMKEIEKTAREVGRVVGVALAAGATAAAVAVKAAIDRADELSKAAQKIGITTEALSTLAYAADLADVELSELQAGLARLTKFQSEAAQGTEDNIALFDALGIRFKNTDGSLRNTADVFRDFAEVFHSLPDGADKTALALDVFGRSGANLIPLMNEGADGIAELEDRARSLGIELDTATGKAAEQFNDQLTDLKAIASGLALAVAKELLPDLIRLTQELQDGAESGDGFASTAENIANGLRGVTFLAGQAYDIINLLAMGIVNVGAKAAAFASRFSVFGTDASTQVFDDIAAVSGARAGDAARSAVGLGGSPAGFSREMSRKQETEVTNDAAAALRAYRDSRANATEADKAAAEAARLAAEALREWNRVLDAGKDAQADLSQTIADNAADLAGPAAQAARVYTVELTRLIAEEDKLRAAKLLTADTERELTIAREQAAEKYQADLADIEKERTRVYDDLISDLEFELKLIGLTNLERETAIALRYADATAASAQGQAITKMLEEIDEKARNQEGIDFLKDNMKGLIVDLTDGVGSLSDAWDDFFDNLYRRVLQMLADQAIEALFTKLGGGGANGGGNGFMNIVGAIFGSRAGGGPVDANMPYLVGEQGPELVIPKSAGTVMTAGQTSRMLGSRGGDEFHFHGPVTKRSRDRFAVMQARRQNRATGEFA